MSITAFVHALLGRTSSFHIRFGRFLQAGAWHSHCCVNTPRFIYPFYPVWGYYKEGFSDMRRSWRRNMWGWEVVGQKWAVKSVILSLLFFIWFRLEVSVFKDRDSCLWVTAPKSCGSNHLSHSESLVVSCTGQLWSTVAERGTLGQPRQTSQFPPLWNGEVR